MNERSSWPLNRIALLMLVTYALTVAFGALAALLAERAAGTWRETTDVIVSRAMPSLDSLSRTRIELRRVQVQLGDLVARALAGRPSQSTRAAFDAMRERFSKSTARLAFSTPSLPGDTPDQAALEQRLFTFESAVEEVLERLDSGEPEQARITLEGSADVQLERLDDVLETEHSVMMRFIIRSHAQMLEQRRSIRTLRHLLAAAAIASALLGSIVVYLLVRQSSRAASARVEDFEMFAGRVAHDIRSPLAALGLNLEVLRRGEVQNGKALATLERGQRTLRSAQQIVEGLLSFAKAGAAPQRGVSTHVGPLVSETLERFSDEARSQGVTLESRIEDAVVHCHPGVVTSLVSNLVANAIRYMGERATKRVEVETKRVDDRLVLRVLDTGPGVPKELRARLFDPYVRGPETKTFGIGLGLATVQRLAQAHGGSVTYAPRPEGGSIFTVELPCEPP